jgi:hypothetical protein
MDWSLFDAAPVRWRSYVTKINQHLVGNAERFNGDIYLNSDTPGRLMDYLSTVSGRDGKLSLSSKKTYIAALSTYLDIACIDNTAYKALIKSISDEIKTSGVERCQEPAVLVTDEELLYAINAKNVHYHIKLMAALLLYRKSENVNLNLIDMCATRHDENNGVDHYLDLNTGILSKANTMPIKISDELLKIIKEGEFPVWVMGQHKLVSTAGMSLMFKQMFKHSYKAVMMQGSLSRSNVNHGDEEPTSEPAVAIEPAPVVAISESAPVVAISESAPTVVISESAPVVAISEPAPVVAISEPAPVVAISEPAPAVAISELTLMAKPKQKVSIKIKIKPKEVRNVRLAEYEWDYFRHEAADDIHIKRLQQLMEKLVNKYDRFYHEAVDSPKGVDKVKAIIEEYESLNTQKNIVNSLCKFLEKTMARHYTDFTQMRDQIGLLVSKHNSDRSVLSYESLIPIFQKLANAGSSAGAGAGAHAGAPAVSQDLKIMAKLLLCIVDYENMDVGALRFSDLVNTRLTDDREYHYLDLNACKWHLREGHTKNKQNRIGNISTEFRDFILALKLNETDGLICHSTGKTSGISKEFKKYVDLNFSSVRASYVTYLDATCSDVEVIQLICRNQGHKLTTALESYRRT